MGLAGVQRQMYTVIGFLLLSLTGGRCKPQWSSALQDGSRKDLASTKRSGLSCTKFPFLTWREKFHLIVWLEQDREREKDKITLQDLMYKRKGGKMDKVRMYTGQQIRLVVVPFGVSPRRYRDISCYVFSVIFVFPLERFQTWTNLRTPTYLNIPYILFQTHLTNAHVCSKHACSLLIFWQTRVGHPMPSVAEFCERFQCFSYDVPCVGCLALFKFPFSSHGHS